MALIFKKIISFLFLFYLFFSIDTSGAEKFSARSNFSKSEQMINRQLLFYAS